VVATDAPLFSRQCQALARRVTAGLARTGTSGSHFSGDLFLAFSTANPGAFDPDAETLQRLAFIPWGHLDPCYEAVVQATEEAVVNALAANEEMTGRGGRRTPALPRDRVTDLLSRAADSAKAGAPNNATGLSQHTARSHSSPRPSRASPASCRA